MDVARVVRVWAPALGKASSGHLIADRLVLTAWHATADASGDAGDGLEVRLFDPVGDGDWVSARRIWPPQAPDVTARPGQDVALLEIIDPSWTVPAGLGPVRFGRLADDKPMRCRAVGFPRSQVRPDGAGSTKDIQGRTEQLTDLGSGLLVFSVTNSASNRPGAWAGGSGAALYCGDLVVGVLIEDQPEYDGRQLRAVHLAELADGTDLVVALRDAGADGGFEPVRSPSEAPVAVGAGRAMVGAIPSEAGWFAQPAVIAQPSEAYQHRRRDRWPLATQAVLISTCLLVIYLSTCVALLLALTGGGLSVLQRHPWYWAAAAPPVFAALAGWLVRRIRLRSGVDDAQHAERRGAPSAAAVPGQPTAGAGSVDTDLGILLGKLKGAVQEDNAALKDALVGAGELPVQWRPHGDTDLPGGRSVGDLVQLVTAGGCKQLVLIGERGSGKTTAAVLIVHSLLESWRPGDPVPVRFRLATWNPKLHLENWLWQQLKKDYENVFTDSTNTTGDHDPSTILRAGIMPILDGLDEIPEALLPEAATWLGPHLAGRSAIITCRTATHERLGGRITLAATTVQMQLLTVPEAAQYLEPQNERWRALLERAADLPSIQALRSPLNVWLAGRVYAGADPAELFDPKRFPTSDAVESHLLASFVPVSFRNALRSAPGHEPNGVHAEAAARWLGFLAAALLAKERRAIEWWSLNDLSPWRRLTVAACTVLGILLGGLCAISVLVPVALDLTLFFGVTLGFGFGRGYSHSREARHAERGRNGFGGGGGRDPDLRVHLRRLLVGCAATLLAAVVALAVATPVRARAGGGWGLTRHQGELLVSLLLPIAGLCCVAGWLGATFVAWYLLMNPTADERRGAGCLARRGGTARRRSRRVGRVCRRRVRHRAGDRTADVVHVPSRSARRVGRGAARRHGDQLHVRGLAALPGRPAVAVDAATHRAAFHGLPSSGAPARHPAAGRDRLRIPARSAAACPGRQIQRRSVAPAEGLSRSLFAASTIHRSRRRRACGVSAPRQASRVAATMIGSPRPAESWSRPPTGM